MSQVRGSGRLWYLTSITEGASRGKSKKKKSMTENPAEEAKAVQKLRGQGGRHRVAFFEANRDQGPISELRVKRYRHWG